MPAMLLGLILGALLWIPAVTHAGRSPIELAGLTADPFDQLHSISECSATSIKEPSHEGLSLTASVISDSRRVAVINGAEYRVGERLQSYGEHYRITEIEPNGVRLTTGNQESCLHIQFR